MPSIDLWKYRGFKVYTPELPDTPDTPLFDIVFWLSGFTDPITGLVDCDPYDGADWTDVEWPTWNNGKPIDFVGTDDHTVFDGLGSLYIPSASFPVSFPLDSISINSGTLGFWYKREGNSPPAGNIGGINLICNDGYRIHAEYISNASTVSLAFTQNGGGISGTGADDAIAVNAWHFLQVTWDCTAGDYSLAIDGTVEDSVTGGTTIVGLTTATRIDIGGYYAQNCSAWHNNIILSTDKTLDMWNDTYNGTRICDLTDGYPTPLAPSITTHPASEEVLTGAPFSELTVAYGDGGETCTLQWYSYSGSAWNEIEGETTSAYTPTTAGTYRVTITNSKGSVNSNSAVLTETDEIDYMEYATNGAAQAAYVADAVESVYPTQDTDHVKATTAASGMDAWHATDPSKSVTGDDYPNSWTSSGTRANQRYHIDLGSSASIKRIYFENYHMTGTRTSAGVKNFTVWGSDSADAFAELTYGVDTDWTELTCDINQLAQHPEENIADPQYVNISGSPQYRYVAFKFADCWGTDYSYMGLRRVEVQALSDAVSVLSEATIKTQGSYALKIVATTDALNKTITYTFSPALDLTDIDYANLNIRSSRTGSNIKLGLHDTGGTTTEVTPNITDADEWQNVEIDLTKEGFDSYTKLLLLGDGTDESTDITDEIGKTVTVEGNTQLDTSDKKFGSASILFDGTGDYLSVADSADFNFGSGDFTVDFWLKRGDLSGCMGIVGQGENGNNSNYSFVLLFNADNTLQLAVCYGSTMGYTNTVGSISDTTTWHHIAIVRDGNTIKIYFDGTADANTIDVTGQTLNNCDKPFIIGKFIDTSAYYFNGRIDTLRVSKGIARWTSNFTPPTSEYAPASINTHKDAIDTLTITIVNADAANTFYLDAFKVGEGDGVAEGEILFGTHFDDEDDWNTSQDASLLNDWDQKTADNEGGGTYEAGYIAQHGESSGKCLKQYWDTGTSTAQNCWLIKNSISIPDEFWLGYRFKVDTNWDWGSATSLKIMKLHYDNGTTLDINWCSSHYEMPSPYTPPGGGYSIATDATGKNWFGHWTDIDDGAWHTFVWHFKHSTNTLECFIDGTDGALTSETPAFPGTGWDDGSESGYALSFGGNLSGGGGGVDEMYTKYDDICIGTTRAKVEEYLGI